MLTSDFYGAYRKFQRTGGAAIQFCWARLMREALFLGELKGRGAVRYGKRIIKQMRLMFEMIGMKGEIGEGDWKVRTKRRRELTVKRAAGAAPEQKEAKRIAKRLREWEEECFRFIKCGLEPTNNAAELTIRQTALDRLATQGGRGVWGGEWRERFWTVLTACALQNVSAMNYLKKCLSVYFGLDISPCLINLAI
ncbi:MAG: transposase [Treponema sp.]|jgi:hypothetical protein|nr:transposase [Treponema sp.]